MSLMVQYKIMMHIYKWHQYLFPYTSAQTKPSRAVMENYLRNASRDGDVEKVKELLENGADVRSVDEV